MIKAVWKKFMAVTLVLTMVVSFMPEITLTVSAAIVPSTNLVGLGTEANPFQIASPEDLTYMRNQVKESGTITPKGGGTAVDAVTAYYKLTADIVLGYWQDDGDSIVEDGEIYDSPSGGTAYTTSNWTPIGLNSSYPFKGSFDGGGHAVSGIYINESNSIIKGLFGCVQGGTVKDMGVKDSYIKGKSYIGGIVGYVRNDCIVENCHFMGSIIGTNDNVGGITGYNQGTIRHCYNMGSISISGNEDYVGGLVGYSEGPTSYIEDCYNMGGVSGYSYVGGIVGELRLGATVRFCYNRGSISGNNQVGGIAGRIYNNNTIVEDCYNMGSVSSDSYVGGIAGISYTKVRHCYNAGSISGGNNVGGIVGSGSATMTELQYCYNSGSISGGNYVGGIAGQSYEAVLDVIADCFYDKQMCIAGGINGQDHDGKAEGKLNSEFINGVAFSGWNSGDMEIWNFTPGLYPRLTGKVDADTDYDMDETDAALVSAAPLYLAEEDTSVAINNNFTVSTANGVSWTSSDDSIISVSGGNGTLEGDGTAVLTASLNGTAKSVILTVDITSPILQSATRDSDTQITVTLSEPCVNQTNANDGGFTVTKTGTTDTFDVTATAQGTDVSEIILTVNDIATAAVKGITVTYTEGGNGKLTDIVGNLMETNGTGIVITPWAPKLGTPADISWDMENPTKATWEAIENVSGYTVQLYKDGEASGDPITGITDTFYDFIAAIAETGTYTFTVQAIGNGETYADSDVSSPSTEYTFISPINAASVNITAPAVGAEPQTAEQVEAATANADYTVTDIVWNEALTAGGKFKAGQVYTATVTLMSKNDKEFQSEPFTSTVEGASSIGTTVTSGTGIGNTVTFIVTFPVTEVLSLTAISITAQPHKITYIEIKDGILSLDGMEVTETYNDGTSKEIVFTDGMATGYTTVPANGAVLTHAANNGNPVTVTHTESGQTTATDNLTVSTPPTYTIIFVNWDGSELDTQTVMYGSGATAPEEPTREGYHFTGWDVDFSNVSSDLTVTASFAINEYTLNYIAAANGSISGAATQAVSHGTAGTAVTAVPDEGYHFVKWSDGVTTASRTDTGVTGNISVTAEFAINEYILTYTAVENGSITGAVTQTVTYGSNGTAVTAVPDEGYHFVKWSDDITTATRIDENVMENISVTAEFAKTKVTSITVKTQPTKLTYTARETLDLAGLSATLTYNDGSTVDVAYDQFGANGITVNPVQGTIMEVAIHNEQAIILTCGTHTTTTDNLTVSEAPTYAITLSEAGTHIFTALTAGYTPVAAITVTVTKTGTGNITNLSATLSGTDADDFTLGALDRATLDSTTTSARFTVKPNDALAPRAYTATVTVTADNGVSQSFNICFTVNAPSAPTIQSVAAGDTHVNITWSSVPKATGYKIYQSTVSGSYGEPLATVSDSVYYNAVGLSNGTTYFFVIRASIGIYDSENSNEVSSTPQLSTPGATVLQTAVAGNGFVNLTWSEVAGSTGYKIYASTTSGSYTSPVDTVAGSVYSCAVTGLSNGTVYYFVVTASNPGGDSGYSNEISAIPKTVPGAPANVSAVAGNRQATVSFTASVDNGGSPITGYVVISNPGNITATGTDNAITVTGLTNGTTYTFRVKAVNEVGNSPESAASNAVTPYNPSSGGNSGGNPTPEPESEQKATPEPTKPDETGVDILVNGKPETAATAVTTKLEDKTVTTITVDDKKVEEKLETEDNKVVITIPVKNDADVVVGQLNGQTVKNMENKEAVLEIETTNVIYTLPASQINIDNVSEQIGKQVELKDIAISVKISEPAEDTVKIVEDTANKNNYQIIIKPIEFEITCSSESKTVEVSKFNAYVERMIVIPEGVDSSKITTGVILNSDGTFSHVPTVITIIDGKYYAKINSLTNSTYLLINSPKTFKDVERHWAEKDIHDMTSRLILSGIGNDKFEPDRDITRAEFVAIVVRALGLMRSGTGKDTFIDVMKKNWYYDAVSTAYEYGIISGYENGKFGPDDKLTREQAMTMIARAMKTTGFKAELADDEADQLLTSFTDASSAAEYAKANIASCVNAGIVSGRSGKLIAPKDNITRAEVAAIVQRLLRTSKLI